MQQHKKPEQVTTKNNERADSIVTHNIKTTIFNIDHYLHKNLPNISSKRKCL